MDRIAAFLRRWTHTTRRARRTPVSLTSVITVSPDVRSSLHPDGIVFLQVRSGTVFRSNRIGAAIWKGLLDRQDLSAIASQIASEHAMPVEQVSQDVTGFLARLEDSGFLVRPPGA